MQLLERSKPTITADFLDERLPGERSALLNAGALEARPFRRSIIVGDDAGISFRPLDWQPETSRRGYFDAADGNVTVASAAQEVFAVSLPWWLRWLGEAVGLGNASKPTELVPGYAWDLGDIWISPQWKIPVLFGRRLNHEAIRSSLTAALAVRSGRSGGLILTGGRDVEQHAGAFPLFASARIGCLLANSSNVFAIDRELLLSAFIAPAAAAAPHEPLALSPDGRRLSINDNVTLDFRSEVHVAIIRRLVEGHREGRKLRAADLLAQAGSEAGTLARAFGRKKWNQLKLHLKSVGGLWGFEL